VTPYTVIKCCVLTLQPDILRQTFLQPLNALKKPETSAIFSIHSFLFQHTHMGGREGGYGLQCCRRRDWRSQSASTIHYQ